MQMLRWTLNAGSKQRSVRRSGVKKKKKSEENSKSWKTREKIRLIKLACLLLGKPRTLDLPGLRLSRVSQDVGTTKKAIVTNKSQILIFVPAKHNTFVLYSDGFGFCYSGQAEGNRLNSWKCRWRSNQNHEGVNGGI